jgi:hypothetical protein
LILSTEVSNAACGVLVVERFQNAPFWVASARQLVIEVW